MTTDCGMTIVSIQESEKPHGRTKLFVQNPSPPTAGALTIPKKFVVFNEARFAYIAQSKNVFIYMQVPWDLKDLDDELAEMDKNDAERDISADVESIRETAKKMLDLVPGVLDEDRQYLRSLLQRPTIEKWEVKVLSIIERRRRNKSASLFAKI